MICLKGWINMRLDQILASQLQTRTRAADAIKEGRVQVNGKTICKPAYEVSESDQITIRQAEHDFVSRAGNKLQGAFEAFHIDIQGDTVLDIGASTGGFTQCCLEHGAKKVYALDVGHLQLSPSLQADQRVVEMEGINARRIQKDWFEQPIQFVCMDVSFISALSILEPLFAQFVPRQLVVLVKPQFECGKNALNKKGVIRHPKYEKEALDKVLAFFKSHGLKTRSIASPLPGRKGNQEYLVYAFVPSNHPAASADLPAEKPASEKTGK